MFRVLSLGVGVQSSTLALKAAHGEIGPMPDAAIMSDTVGEPAAVYEQLRWLQSGNTLPYPVHVVSAGDLGQRVEDALDHKTTNVVPWYTESPNGRGVLNRSCTRDYKITPVRRKIRSLFKERFGRLPRKAEVELWIGISTDETIRATPSTVGYIVNRFPFLGLPPHDNSSARASRADCLLWLKKHEYPIPVRSRCKFCPKTSDEEWARIKETTPEEFREAVAMDRRLRIAGIRGVKEKAYMHPSLTPLEDVDFSKGKQGGFLDECKGMCGV